MTLVEKVRVARKLIDRDIRSYVILAHDPITVDYADQIDLRWYQAAALEYFEHNLEELELPLTQLLLVLQAYAWTEHQRNQDDPDLPWAAYQLQWLSELAAAQKYQARHQGPVVRH